MNKISCVIFDWAGTTVDYGCFAPVAAFISAFKEMNLTITNAEARGPMGMTKIEHIRELLKLDSVVEQFKALYGREWCEDDAQKINIAFEKVLFASLKDYTDPISGVIEIVDELRARGLKIGSTSGYTKKMMEVVAPEAAQKGYTPDCWFTSDGLPGGRPQPYMIYRVMMELAVGSANEIIKVGDTISDIREGVNAGVWSVGVVLGSSELGLSEAEVEALSPQQRTLKISQVKKRMLEAGAHFVIETMAELPALIDAIEKRKDSEKPLARPYFLLTPGPLTSSDRVKRAMLADWCTWDDDYNVNIVQKIRQSLLDLACVETSKYTSVLLQGSGTYAVEAAVTCSVLPDEKLLVFANGAYGQRISQIASYANINTTTVTLDETQPLTGEMVAAELDKDSSITHVAIVHCETTTGILSPLEQIAQVVKGAGKTLIVDAMSSFGAIPIDMGALGIDVLISSANKCIQGVPGFGFIILTHAMIQRCKGNSRTLSLDIYDQWQQMEAGGGGKWRFTSPTHVVRAFAEALGELKDQGGVSARYERYTQNQRILIEGMKAAGFDALLPRELQSPIITSFVYPSSDFSFEDFYTKLKSYGFVLYPGKISQCDTFRIGNIGDVYPSDIENLVKIIAAVHNK